MGGTTWCLGMASLQVMMRVHEDVIDWKRRVNEGEHEEDVSEDA